MEARTNAKAKDPFLFLDFFQTDGAGAVPVPEEARRQSPAFSNAS